MVSGGAPLTLSTAAHTPLVVPDGGVGLVVTLPVRPLYRSESFNVTLTALASGQVSRAWHGLSAKAARAGRVCKSQRGVHPSALCGTAACRDVDHEFMMMHDHATYLLNCTAIACVRGRA